MKSSKRIRTLGAVKTALIALLAAAIVLVALPFGAFGATAKHKSVKADDAPAQKASVTVKLTVNFYSAQYEVDGYPYNMWLWSAAGEGKGYSFNPDTVTLRDKQWKTLTAQIENVPIDSAAPNANAIGVIVRRRVGDNEWGYQTKDMFITADKIVDNAVTIYLVADDENIYYDVEEPDLSIKFKEAKFGYLAGTYRVNFTTGAVKLTEKSVIKIVDSQKIAHGMLDCTVVPDGADKNPNVGKTSGNIDFVGEFDFGETYMLVDESTDADTALREVEISKTALYDNDEAFGSKYNYDGDDLGVTFAADKISYKLWAPASKSVKLNIYANGDSGAPERVIDMTRGEKGVFYAETEREMSGKYYTYSVVNAGVTNEIVDPYARSAGKNGKRGMILDLDTTDPEGWANHSRPASRGSYTNAIIYEAHVRDLTIHSSSNVSEANRGKFLGMTEKASEQNGNKTTPLDYIKDLGVTEVHILPMFDFATVDESFTTATYNKDGEYNWGYDPLNYNVPEGSYSSDPADGAKRVKELKQMVMALHEAGIKVIMDVVYNHVSNAADSNFQKILPNYFFRTDSAGKFTSASGCGNDTASERYMYSKFIVDSVNYWADEYKIDGFRFDLMGLHDTVTMNKVYDTLAEKNPDVMVYGEGWEMGAMVQTTEKRSANMKNAAYMPHIAFFNDITRDAIKGGGYGMPIEARGFAEGAKKDAAVYVGAVGGTNNGKAGYGTLEKQYFAASPVQNINYVSCHDNASLWDKINACALEPELATKKAMNRLAATTVFTSQGSVLMLAGEELLRSKPTTKDNNYDNGALSWLNEDYYFAENSYKSPDSVNAIDWSLAETNADMVAFYKELIALRKNTPQFHLSSKNQIDDCVKLVDDKLRDGIASYLIKNPDNSDDECVVLLFNGTSEATSVGVPYGAYDVYVNGDKACGTSPIAAFSGDRFTVGAYSAVVMKANLSDSAVKGWTYSVSQPPKDGGDNNKALALGLGIGIPAAVLVAGGAVFGVMCGKKRNGKGKKSDDNADDTADTNHTAEANVDRPDVEQSTDGVAEEEHSESADENKNE